MEVCLFCPSDHYLEAYLMLSSRYVQDLNCKELRMGIELKYLYEENTKWRMYCYIFLGNESDVLALKINVL